MQRREEYYTSGTVSLRGRQMTGFTIVELLIVVVVIAILAAVTIVAYNGITAQARDSALKSDLTTGVKQLHLAKVEDGSFPGSKPSYLGSTIQYTGGGDSFCITASKGSRAFHMTQSGTIQSGVCSGHTVGEGGDGGGNEIIANSPIQNVTPAQCAALPTFTGSNNDAIRTVTDSRGGTTRTYEIAKVADGNCWMLTNLKLGSTTDAITLTPADSDVGADFSLPKLAAYGSLSRDVPRVIGPVPGDTGVGSTNFGYFYNWPAATAGETQSSLPGGNNTAMYSVCPAGWRLPTGRNPGSDIAALDIAFGGTGEYAISGASLSHWQFSGAFKGALAGYAGTSAFHGQGSEEAWWSSSTHANTIYALPLHLQSDRVRPGDGSADRFNGFSVRCLLK